MQARDSSQSRQLPPSLSISINHSQRGIASPLSPTLPRSRRVPRSPFVATRAALDYKNMPTRDLQQRLLKNQNLISQAEKNDKERLARLQVIRTDITNELDRRKTKEMDRLSNGVQTLVIDDSTSPPLPSNHVVPPRDAKIAYMPLNESFQLLKQHDIELKIARAEARISTPTQSGQVTPTPEGALTPLGRPLSTSEQQARMMAFLFPEADTDDDDDDDDDKDAESMDYEMSSEEDHP